MKAVTRVILCGALAINALAHAYAWSVRDSNKTNVRVRVVDEDGRPVQGQRMTFRLKSGSGKELSFSSDRDGMVSFREDIGSYAICTFDIDKKVHYPIRFDFQSNQDGSTITGVVKRIAKPSRMVDSHFRWSISNAVEKVGVDLMLGDLVQPYGKGRCADLYLATRRWKDDGVKSGSESRKWRSEYWFERGEAGGEFSVVGKDVGCELPTPSVAPKTMLNNSEARFEVDRRSTGRGTDFIGESRYVLFKVVRPNGVFYGLLIGGVCSCCDADFSGELMYRINPNPGDRGIVWTTEIEREDDWREYVKIVYADEDAAKAKKASGKDEVKVDAETAARRRKMMEEGSYSGIWEGKTWGLDRVSFCFDKGGFGRFELNGAEHTCIFARNELSGWFHWTADDKGVITARAVDGRHGCGHGVYEFRMRYDCGRNVMKPDLNSALFVGRVFPRPDNLCCELPFVSDGTIEDAGNRYRWALRGNCELTKAFGRIESAPKKEVASLKALCSLAKERCRGSVGLVVRGHGTPEIKICTKRELGTGNEQIRVDVQYGIQRAGDAAAPKFKCLGWRQGPDIADKKALEIFFDCAELAGKVKSIGGKSHNDFLLDDGMWTMETWNYVAAYFNQGEWGKCKELLETAMGKWYTFPLEVREVDWAKSE